jgi:aminomethyltransferase
VACARQKNQTNQSDPELGFAKMVPLYSGEKQVGKATTTSWSPILKKMIALASVETAHSKLGATLQMEITIEAIRLKTNAKVTGLPFFNPTRKTATPV